MAEFKVRTNGNSDPHDKPRVYFTCHPDDFDRYFDKICEDVFRTHDPAIYYTEDMSEALDENNINVDLKRMNLFLVPITFRLMNEPNRAMAVDIAYAKEKNIPILPFMMESGIDEIYSLPKNFGERQYLSPFSSDKTGISYENKLENYLKSILISDEMAKRVRAAFDAYIFLSYRKKDRRYADELMRIIHNIPGCRDIAIWYDEFLTPGESFIKNIEKAMSDSRLFALLVTPNLLESGNFVMTEEYPMAKKAEMDILPTEMQETDHDELFSKFDGISEPVKVDDEHFTETMLSVIKNIAISENDDDPEHNFLIGLAYLDGIDVEVNLERGIELITKAAEAELPEAMERLFAMYRIGDKVTLDYQIAMKWAERLADFYRREYGEEHPDTLVILNNFAITCIQFGDYQKALILIEKVYKTQCKVLGKKDPDTLISLNNLAYMYSQIENQKKSLKLNKIVYKLRCKVLGEEHPDTLASLNNIGMNYYRLGECDIAIELHKKAYNLKCKILGEEHPDTLASLNNIGITYFKLKNYKKALELIEKSHELSSKVLGEEHPSVLTTLYNLAGTYNKLGDFQKALELNEKVYELRCIVLGDEHPDTLTTLNNIVYTYGQLGAYQKMLELSEKLYALQCKVYGENHPNTLDTARAIQLIKMLLSR